MKHETLLKHALLFYSKLASESITAVIDGEDVTLYEGPLTKVFTQDCDLPASYYTPVKSVLEEYECLKVIQRGSRSQPSIVRLLKAPPFALIDDPDAVDALDIPIVKSSPAALTTRAQVVTLRKELENLKAWRESQKGLEILKALSNIETRLVRLENTLLKSNTNKTGEKT